MRRRNDRALPWVRALAFAFVAVAGLATMPFYSAGAVGAVAIAAGLLGFASPAVAVLGLVVVFSLPVAASNLAAGAILLLVGLAFVPYLGQRRAAPFLALMLSFALIPLHAEWAIPVVAGLALGAGEGAVAAAIACLAVELGGLLLGLGSTGTLASGGGRAILALSPAPADPLTFGWLVPGLKALQPGGVLATLGRIGTTPLMLVQPALWAAAAAVAGTFQRPVTHPRRALFAFGGGVAGVAVLWVGSLVASTALHGPVPAGVYALAGVAGLAFSLIGAALETYVFPWEVVETPTTGTSREDADVDELLRLIATAEETIASRHTVHTTVLITDMKSFSQMTEEEGSMISAKLVQRHRDLLLPVLQRHGGKGKSTGGDGLVGAFDAPGAALTAAVEMQRELTRFNSAHPAEKQLQVRIGIARGEVVVDRGGRPFIGNGLNLAARVMDLGDGGQVLAAGDVVDAAGETDVRTFDHGPFQVKNIALAIDVREVLWADGQTPRTLRGLAPHVEPDAVGETA